MVIGSNTVCKSLIPWFFGSLMMAPSKSKSVTSTTKTTEFGDVPVNGFWSITVYNKDGYMEKNDQNVMNILRPASKPDLVTSAGAA
ncbi:MAG: hypothetical protein R6W85_03000, partial [Gillisia sp.]